MKKFQDIQLFSILKNIPYENVSKILRLEMPPEKRPRDSQLLLSDHREFHFGGTCFSLVNLVIRSLSVEAYNAYPVQADIHRRTFPHFFAIAQDNDKKYLIDPGYLINKPIEIKEDGISIQKNGAITFVLQYLKDGQYQLKTVTSGQHKIRYTFHIKPLDNLDFQAYWVDSFNYMNAIVASRFVDDKFIYINGNYVQIRSKGNIEKYDQEDKALEYLNRYFELDENIVHTANELLKKYRTT